MKERKFRQRAGDWIFYGDQSGYIALRPQRSGLYKLVGVAGDDSNPVAKGRSLMKAFKDMMSEGKPIWGMVSTDIKDIANRLGLTTPSPWILKTIIKHIPPYVFGGAKINQILPDGGVELEYADVGSTTKYFISNPEYYQWLANGIKNNQNIPIAVRFVLEKAIRRMGSSDKITKVAQGDHLPSFISLEDVL